MDSFRLYHTWFEPLAQLSPDGCASRVRNLTWLIVGLYRANALCRPSTALGQTRLCRVAQGEAYS